MGNRTKSLDEALTQIRVAVLDQAVLVRALATGSRRGHSLPWRRAELRYVDVKAGLSLQLTTYDEYQATVRNALAGSSEAIDLVDELVDQPVANWHVETTAATMQLRVTKKGEGLLHVKATEHGQHVDHSHDRHKPRMLPADHLVLRAVGITDQSGQVKPSRQSKYRQIDEFLRLLAPALDAAMETGRIPRPTTERPLRMVDLGCGNAYLTFAAAAFVRDVRREPVEVIGVDSRPEARLRNAAVAAKTQMSDSVRFQASTIEAVELADRPDVVLSLHACDTATDESLARAVRWHAPVILAAPCCHHDIQAQLSQTTAPEPYALISRHGILRERFADVLTDALRASIVRQHGYRVDVVQFVGSEHTPRNTLLRAVAHDSPPSSAVERDYGDLTTTWGVRPALARMLASPTSLDDQALTSRSGDSGPPAGAGCA